MRAATSLTSALARDPGARWFAVFWGGLAVVDLAMVCGVPLAGSVGAVACVVAAGTWGQSWRVVLGCAATGWLLVNGFLVHHDGVLGWDGSADVRRLLLLVAAAWFTSRPGILDGFLTGARRRSRAARVRSHAGPGHPGRLGGQEGNAVRR